MAKHTKAAAATVEPNTNGTPATAPESDVLTYGAFNVRFDLLPRTSQLALARKGLAHVLGNEAASKVTAWKDTDAAKGATEADIVAKKAEFQAGLLQSLWDGTLGSRAGTPRGSALETVMRDIAREVVLNAARALKAKDKNFKMPDAKAVTALADKYVAKHPEVRAEAEARMAKAKAAAGDDIFGDVAAE